MQPFHRSCGWALGTALLATVAPCDEVLLRGGGRVSGVVVERTERSVVIETGPGRVTLAMSRVEKILESRSVLETFQERAGALTPRDSEGWAALARWAAEHDLVTPSRSAWQRVVAFDPQNAEANAALGRVALDGTWMAAEDAYRARGYVQYEGRWMTPAEHEAAMRERAADQAAELQARESELRVREAEARTREAEARARDAASGADYQDGIPYLPYGYGYGYGLGYGGGGLRPSHPIGPRPPGMGPGRPGPPRHGQNAHPTLPAPTPAPTSAPAKPRVRATGAAYQPPRP
jgi:hypothetical protein